MRAPGIPLLVVALGLFGTVLFGNLQHPLLWQDEAETAMFARRIVQYGYPVVHGPRNVVNEFGAHAAAGVKERDDAYIGKTWGDFYFAVPGLLWARGSDDPYAKTLRLRLPFAFAGMAGVLLFGWAVLPALAGRGRRALFFALYLLLAATSISLVLHLREVRYYPLLVLNLAALTAVHLRRAVFGTLGFRRYALLETLLLFALFHVFFAAWFPVLGLLALERGLAAWRAGGTGRARARRVGCALLPTAAATAAVAPFLVYFETFEVASRFSESVGTGLAGYLRNVAEVLRHLIRHELLVPALVARAAVAIAARRDPPGPARRTAALLLLFVLGYALFGCVNPLVYERYFVATSPVLSLAFLLDAFSLADALPRHFDAGHARTARTAAVAGLVALAGASLALRAGEIRGRVIEIAVPYRGPLDYVIPYLRERVPDPASLVIATNYEAHPLMYYLGCRVIVGLSLNNIGNERDLVPDVVIPRRRWPRGLVEVRRFLARGDYVPTTLPVLDVHYNNVPSLSRMRSTPDPHRFRTPVADLADPGALRIYMRADG
jgi:hypothetical protein